MSKRVTTPNEKVTSLYSHEHVSRLQKLRGLRGVVTSFVAVAVKVIQILFIRDTNLHVNGYKRAHCVELTNPWAGRGRCSLIHKRSYAHGNLCSSITSFVLCALHLHATPDIKDVDSNAM